MLFGSLVFHLSVSSLKMIFQRLFNIVTHFTSFANVSKRIQVKGEPVVPECIFLREPLIAVGALERALSGVGPNVRCEPLQINAHLMTNPTRERILAIGTV